MSETVLVFEGEKKRKSLLFLGFLLVSLLFHFTGFYLFRVIYRDPTNLTRKLASVSLLSPRDPNDAPILRWIRSEDPKIAAAPPEVIPPGLLEARYAPFQENDPIQPIVPEGNETVPALPDGRNYLKLLEQSLAPPPAASRQPVRPASRILVGPKLRNRAPTDSVLPPARHRR